ncbi:hypothetical protein Y1Q_0014019 [Alligator mississippiensis]|uniref:Uncharacterized protein n=1 Tax=Alligator mississippiensis TaxID=8496 RepID=A0A151PDT3_ALLMI|nr:hypothetical protein Y1Q_0014019 [Alligator mississippiensis]
MPNMMMSSVNHRLPGGERPAVEEVDFKDLLCHYRIIPTAYFGEQAKQLNFLEKHISGLCGKNYMGLNLRPKASRATPGRYDGISD